MSNNLRKLEKELRSYAKRCKDVKYTSGLLLTFLLTGVLTLATSGVTDKSIEQQRRSISNSISDMRTSFKKAKAENNKLLKGANLELVQLMEQGDQVVKSPWSSWQFGMNYFYNNWSGTYKGRGDKKEKYPYEGIFERSADPYERYTAPSSGNYSLLPKSSNPRAASSNARQGQSMTYGIASTSPVLEPIVAFEVSAGINPRVFTAPTVTPLSATQPQLPQAINFIPVTPQIGIPAAPVVNPPQISAPATGNGDDQWIQNNGSVAPIAQQNMSGGTLNVTGKGNLYDVQAIGIDMIGEVGVGHQLVNNGIQNFNYTDQSQFAAMKLVGGHTINIDNVTINYTGSGTGGYQRWLFHTDGHNDRGESTWLLNNGTKIDINGTNLVLYTSQYHQSPKGNTGFVTDATITTAGSNNIGWITLDETHGVNSNLAQQYFHNRAGTINLGGNGDILAYIMQPSNNTDSGFSFINDGTVNMTGNNQFGIIINGGSKTGAGYTYIYNPAEILLNSPLKISGKDSAGIVFRLWMNLEGGVSFDNRSTTIGVDNVVTAMPTTSRASIINIDMASSSSGVTGIYFNSNSTNPFKLNKYTLNIDGKENTGIFVADGIVDLGGTGNAINITNGSKNIGIYAAATDAMTTAAKITVSADSSIGIFGNNAGTIANSGDISVTGASVKAIVANNGKAVTSTGKIDVTGTAASATDGAVGLAAMNNGSIAHSGTGTIDVDGGASIGVFAQSGGSVTVGASAIKTKNGAFNTYAKGGTINLNGTTVDTGQKSLAFFTDGAGTINFTGPVTANIAGGTDANTRGTAFLYQGTAYSPFTAGDIATWATTRFTGMNNLTLNMAPDSRLFIARDVSMNLSDTGGSGLSGAIGANIVGSGYKTFMLYQSKLALDQSIDLDNPSDLYNQLEISNSSIDNNNSNTITGTQAGQTAIAQENISGGPRTDVTINNNGTITLSGANSTGMYAKFGVLNNNATGTITLGDTSTGLYGVDDSILTNTGTISMGSQSTGMYSEGSTTQGVSNAGNITSTGTKSVGVLFKPATTLAPGAILENTGTINLGDESVGLYGESTATNYLSSNSGNITVGNSGIGIFGYTSDITGGAITVGNKGVGIYSQGGNVNLVGGVINTGVNEAVGVYTVGSGQTITNSGTAFGLGNTSVAIANAGSGNTINSTVANVNLGDNNIYIYSNDTAGTVTNTTNLTASGSGNYGIYSAGNVTNSGNIDFGAGTGNVGIYSIKGGTATNNAVITIGGSNPQSNEFGIGMAAGYQTTDSGNIINNGTINVNGDFSIGMYASGNSVATNASNIVLNGNNTTGIYADNGATVNNSGNISTASGNYSNVVGVYLGTGSTLNNTGNITIDGSNAVGVYLKGGTIANYGNITVNGSTNPSVTVQSFTTPPTGKSVGGASIDAPAGAQTATVTINGIQQTPVNITTFAQNPIEVPASSIGLYVNTSGVDYTNAINGLGSLTQEADLIIGTEATEMTNSKAIVVNDPNILNPYNNAIRTSGVSDWNIYSAGLTWLATPTLDPTDGTMTSIYMVKIPYTAWAGKEPTPVESTDTYNFLDGLEQRYGVEELGTRERLLFSKLNSIGNNEEILLYQAIDEMMGHQYANTQQRVNATGNILDKEFNYLRNDWSNPSKEANKIKIFGSREEYNTDTAGIIDYKSKSYGVAYVHEDETIKLGNGTGWYAGYVNNRFRFKDIGKSKENQHMLKAGIFKSKAFDDNGSLKWTISGEGFIGQNDMNRKFLVVDEIFNAKGTYHTYGLGLKNEISKEFRTSERTSIKPYGALELEYGRFNTIKEKDGEIRLEVKGNDYFSVKPEVGVEFKYKQPMAVRTNLTASLGVAYENELGKVADVKNKARVRYTEADWFNIRGEKEDRRGNFKADFKLGIENTRFGVTFNAGYDTKGENVRAGIGLRAIY